MWLAREHFHVALWSNFLVFDACLLDSFCCVLRVEKMPTAADEDRMKLQFTLDALKKGDPFAHNTTVPSVVCDAIAWHAERSPQEIMQFHEDLMSKLEAEASKMW